MVAEEEKQETFQEVTLWRTIFYKTEIVLEPLTIT